VSRILVCLLSVASLGALGCAQAEKPVAAPKGSEVKSWYVTTNPLPNADLVNLGWHELKRDGDRQLTFLVVEARMDPAELWQKQPGAGAMPYGWKDEDFQLLTQDGQKIPAGLSSNFEHRFTHATHMTAAPEGNSNVILAFVVDQAAVDQGDLKLQVRVSPPIPITPDKKVDPPK
jgi:hypothetical protein